MPDYTEEMREQAQKQAEPGGKMRVGEQRHGEDHEPMLHCPVCSEKLLARKCKLYCARCGYYMSCADYI